MSTSTLRDTTDLTTAPEHVSRRAGELYAAGHEDAAVALLRDDWAARRDAQLAADRIASAPSIGTRIAGAVVGVGKGAFIPFMLSLAAGAFAGPHVAALLGSVTVAMGALGALGGFVTGGAV